MGAGILKGLAKASNVYANYALQQGQEAGALQEKLAGIESTKELALAQSKADVGVAVSKLNLDYSIMDEKAKEDKRRFEEEVGLKKETIGVQREQVDVARQSEANRTAAEKSQQALREKEYGSKESEWVLGPKYKDQYGGATTEKWWEEKRANNPGLSDDQIATKENLIPKSKWMLDAELKKTAAMRVAKDDPNSAKIDARYKALQLSAAGTGITPGELGNLSPMLKIVAADQVLNGEWNLKPKDYTEIVDKASTSFTELDSDTKKQYEIRSKPLGMTGQALYTYEQLKNTNSLIPDRGTEAGQNINQGILSQKESKIAKAESLISQINANPDKAYRAKQYDELIAGSKTPELRQMFQTQRDMLRQDTRELNPAIGQVLSQTPILFGAMTLPRGGTEPFKAAGRGILNTVAPITPGIK